ncbi:hypothetical protein NDU88_000651 [Pleurodeles waltl]|uniref:Uncharacterized protein n=1 Tax=Pleurodeles waltl TaxID=8319 RepID=A0AAV7LAR6_PLEWA|nr:hypothetical protein NDU88_000651 [Pleurodeles waltl]
MPTKGLQLQQKKQEGPRTKELTRSQMDHAGGNLGGKNTTLNLHSVPKSSNDGGSHPTELGNRSAIFEKASPDARWGCDGHTFFTCSDFCQATVKRRWRLRQLIKPVQELGGTAYLLNPACLKIVLDGYVRTFTSDIKASEYLKNVSPGFEAKKTS